MWHVWWRGEMHAVFWWGNLRERSHLGNRDIDGRIILKLVCKKQDERAFTGFVWQRIERDMWRALVNTAMYLWV
jgi:hypothetical protein